MSRKSIPGTTVLWLGSITRLHSAKTTRYLAEIFKLMLLSAVVWAIPAMATTQFSYTLPRGLTTSAGVYQPDGTLVRTLWRNVPKTEGVNSDAWDDLDDQGKPAPAGNYEIRVISHNVNYVWEGAVGNTSTYNSGKTVHFGMFPIRDMAFAGNTGFYTTASNEGHYNFRSFNALAPQQVTDSWTWVVDTRTPLNEVIKLRAYSNDRSWSLATTDGTWVYFAAPKGWNEKTKVSDQPGYVTAMNVSDHSQAYFTNEVDMRLSNGAIPMYPYPNGIKVGGLPGLSGIAVQKTGNILAVAVEPDNTIYLFDKRSGAPLSSIYVDSPRRMVFAPNNDLWVTAGTSVICYTNMNTAPTLKSTIPGFLHPLAVGVSPNGKTAVVADGGASMQLKAYSTSSLSNLWTYGQLGGNPVNGPNVRNDRFWFTNGELSGGVGGVDWATMKEDTFVTYAPDGTFWVGDGDNGRAIHFNANRTVKEKIATGKGSYVVAVDANNPTRVFDGFHEYKVDYTKPLAGNNGSWTLVKNWRAKLPSQYWAGANFRKGLLNVATLSNGRTYAQIFNGDAGAWEVGELTTDGVRLTGAVLSDRSTLNSDGSIRRALASKTNGSFEDPDRSPWGLMNNSQQTDIVTAPGAATDGDNYLNVAASGGPSRVTAGIYQNIAGINLAEGKSFTLSFDLKDGINKFGTFSANILSLNSGNGFISEAVISSLKSTLDTNTGWTHYQGDFVLPDSQPDFKLLQIRLILIKDNGDGSTYDGMIDNVALAQTGGLAIVDRGFPRWWNRSLTGFDAIGNPQWSAWSVLASASGGISDPVPHLVSADPPQSPITSSNILVSYDQSLKPGWHLGGIRAGDNKWLWKTSPSSTLEDFVNPIGNYEIGHGVGNGGNVVTTSGRHVIAGYHGEGYRSFQASQFMHFYDDGLFIGQFGTPNTDIFYNLLPTETVLTGPVEFTRAGYTAGVLAGFAGNAMSPVLTKAPNGITYLYVNDEWGYGPQRWRIDGLDTVQEYKGSGSLGGAITLSF